MRSAESWAESFSATIYKWLKGHEQAPPPMQAWTQMCLAIVRKTSFPLGLDKAGLMAGFENHAAAVKEAIPADKLLVLDMKEGWAPLCEFLGVPVRDEPFPRTNNREEFWDLVSEGA